MAARSPTCVAWRCARPQICIRADPRPTPGTHSSSLTPLAPCPTPSELKVLAGFDEGPAHETTRALNRIRSLLTQIHPALERVFVGGMLYTGLVLDLLEKFAGPTGLKGAGRGKVLRFARSHPRRDPAALVDRIFAALGEQTVVVPATAAVELVIPKVAGQVKELKDQRGTVAREVEGMLEDFPLAGVLMSMPGIGTKTAAQILMSVGDGTAFETPDHLAAYAGIATHRRQTPQRRGDLLGPPPLQRYLRDAPRRHLLPAPDHHAHAQPARPRSLTQNIEPRHQHPVHCGTAVCPTAPGVSRVD